MVLLASEYDQSRFFKAVDLEGERKLRIKSATTEVIGVGAEKEDKLVVGFTNDKRGLVLNRVNNRTLRGAFGDDTAGWTGKVIIIFPMMVEMRGKMVPGIRVRIPPPKQSGLAAVAAKLDLLEVDAADDHRRRRIADHDQGDVRGRVGESLARDLIARAVLDRDHHVIVVGVVPAAAA